MTDNTKLGLSTANNHDEIDLRRLLGTLIAHRWLIIGITALFSVAGIIYSLLATPIYQADAMVQVEQNVGNLLVNDLSQILPNSQPGSSTEIELIKSRMVTGKTVDDLNLETVVQQKYSSIFGRGWARLTGTEPAKIALSRLNVPANSGDVELELTVIDAQQYVLSNNGTEIIKGKVGALESGHGISLLVSEISAEPGTVFEIAKLPRLVAINNLLDALTVEDKGKDTGVLALSLVGDDPVLVRNILNSISKNYLLQNVERKSEEAAKSLDFLKDQLPEVRSFLDSAEDKLNRFRQANDSVDLSLEAKSVLDTVVGVEAQLNELTLKEAEISKLYTKEHPAYRALMEKRATLQQEKDKLNKRVSVMPKTQQVILRLTRDVQAAQEIYMQLLNKQQKLGITKASTVGNVRIVDPAVTQPRPVKPQKTIIVLIATLLGGLFSTGFVLLKTMLHRGIESPEQLEQLGINVYACIPLSELQHKSDRETMLSGKRSSNRSSTLLAVGNLSDLAIEAVRSLRTRLHFALLEAKNNVLMISGPSPSIGKTLVSINLAAVIAQAGRRILVVDADMRKGHAHSLLNCELGLGLSDVLSGQASPQQAIKQTSIENLSFISRGKIPSNPSELLMHNRLTEFLEWAGKEYDIVLVDTPPILAVTDAVIVARNVGTTLLVARYGVNSLKEIEVSIRHFEQNGIEIQGIILNAVENKSGNVYYAYEYK
ncbi:TPA: tyrosine-protein kinase Wzc [Klebsiella pneumoniae]|uniref:Tyrosine autokinase n=1 Tax=Klebsiella pneumoniae TaxID=573 RepID=A0A2X1RHH9_KLEPN|nr:tyrosine-protein kinase Wzc [Klebsiella pneumoniae]AYJ93107.1 tyrosine-protein kinase Wzc [Klebsiella pneumoniae]RLO15865.1 tyrosine-protein kinase Wzc [Klebsiella pneumoniae]SPX55036.1 tyrosine autokinase [Klebsiella pneumoniae]SQC24184.1 tyrosine autokinase [Klebsiella pneumoniae]